MIYCARAASGQLAVAPPRAAMNSRRFSRSSILKGDGGGFMTLPPSLSEARSRLG